MKNVISEGDRLTLITKLNEDVVASEIGLFIGNILSLSKAFEFVICYLFVCTEGE